MEDKDIKTLRELLKVEGRKDIATLLRSGKSEIDVSDQYGSYLYSLISKFLIYAPLKQYRELKKLRQEDIELLLKLVLEIYPLEARSPEITSVEFRILQKETNTERTYVGRTIRVFISYYTRDKNLAGMIKLSLEVYGFDVFLAHEDIRPSRDWQDTILQNLDSTDIFIPLVTQAFKKSSWTDQESGYALAKGKKIIPLAINGSLPYGFVASIQAIKCTYEEEKNDLTNSIKKLIDEVKKDEKFKKSYIDGLIRVFTNSGSFDNANIIAQELEEAESLTTDQVNQIIKASTENSQIKHSFGANPRIKRVVKKFESFVDKKLLTTFNAEYYPEKKIPDIPF